MKLYLVTLKSMVSERDRQVHVIAEDFAEAAGIAQKERYAGEYPTDIKLVSDKLWLPTEVRGGGLSGKAGCHSKGSRGRDYRLIFTPEIPRNDSP